MGKLQIEACPSRTCGQLVPRGIVTQRWLEFLGMYLAMGEWEELAGPRDHIGLSLL